MTPDAARASVFAFCQFARTLGEKRGKLQHLLRAHAQAILQEVAGMISAPEPDTSKRIATLWLQNVLEMPIPLFDPQINKFCQERRCTFDELVAAADELDVNVAALDDLIRLSFEHISRRK